MATKPLSEEHERSPFQPMRLDSFLKVEKFAFTHRVGDDETWITVTRRFALKSPEFLIHFNFNTNKPWEVNWYLRKYVGCNVSTDGWRNWAFSKSAIPGIIKIPRRHFDFEEDGSVVEGMPFDQSPVVVPFENETDSLDAIDASLGVLNVIEISLAVFPEIGGALGIALPAGVTIAGIFVGGLLAMVSPAIAVGAGHQGATNNLIKGYAADGFSLGLVTTVKQERITYIKQWVKPNPIGHVLYNNYGIKFRDAFNAGLIAGVAQGRKFNTVNRKNFFVYLHSHLKEDERTAYSEKWSNWSESKKRNYYERLAAIYKHFVLK